MAIYDGPCMKYKHLHDWAIFGVNVGKVDKHSIHGALGNCKWNEITPVTSWLYIMKYKPFITDLRATTTVSPAKITGFHQQTSAKLKNFGCADFSAEDVRQKMVF